MSKQLDQIKQPVKEELERFEKHFRKAMKSNVALLDKIMFYIVQRKGKQMRPIFVFLSAKAAGGTTEATYNAASLVELLHTATLVHDDVVDESLERRGFFSINALWKNKIAVLVGDYLLSQGLLLAVNNNEFSLLRILSRAVKEMSEGELMQIEKARKLDIQEAVYFDIIRQKTASLIAAACEAGAVSAGVSPEVSEQFRVFGEKVGIAFQIKDDLFDYGTQDVGKPLGIDIKEKKMTLPLIYALQNTDRPTKKHIINLIKNHSKDQKSVKEVISFVHASGGLQYAESRMMDYCREAIDLLKTLADNDASKSLVELIDYVTNREN
ncbi:MAG: polyprenyl synthetase family protein [Saprospiraceae bacterium]|jgi:octaprenyl-diphosphate synthase|uniref:polyprenyl synthetase family protein n=1 Tax=Candidatus Brachybacter algidus TaxID=2982024 RepID=UPI001B47F577|nr:polyprenyl synthetase family protein [Candidatus Brachybacter algidus]MBP7539667.1 polyprenyl synthetase family protein [Saprospiraceae bacterium]MBK8357407.1 polyprenyl synthetase family protein [Candidatus Brachybacter algidus]MBK8604916.1 polyprenyl synthetase family protein [Candidatus Brachybacter algidus]MBK9551970.1 polyprenyl synthetase family protein [Candidatus Brachybacter algidus]